VKKTTAFATIAPSPRETTLRLPSFASLREISFQSVKLLGARATVPATIAASPRPPRETHLPETRVHIFFTFKHIANASTKHSTMTTTPEHDERIAKLTFSSVYPHYVRKVETKGRSKAELHQVIHWLTGFDDKKLKKLIDENVTFAQFFKQAKLNPNANLITGTICGYRIEDIETPLTKQARYLDKLVDELAKGRKMEKILRTA
jgi:hypothetical protein